MQNIDAAPSDEKTPTTSEYVAILRCQTWNVWPEKTVIEPSMFEIEHEGQSHILARVRIVSHLNRTNPEIYCHEATESGLLVWDGLMPGFYLVRDAILTAPGEVGKFAFHHRNAYRGEVDICINFMFAGEITRSLIGAIQTTALAIMSLINLQFKDYLTPTAPLRLSKLANGGGSISSTALVTIQPRTTLTKDTLDSAFLGIAKALHDPQYGEKLRIALELYAAHFNERQARVRFLLLVMGMETLAKATRKHPVAISLLEQWQQELMAEMLKYDPLSEEFQSFEALSREIDFRTEVSIRTQVRKLFRELRRAGNSDSVELERRALRVYDKRSTLVHDGHLPTDELLKLEIEARELLETLFISAVG